MAFWPVRSHRPDQTGWQASRWPTLALGKEASPWHGTSQWSVRLLSLTSMPQVILLLAPQTLPSLGRRPSILVSPRAFFLYQSCSKLWSNSSLLFGFFHWGGSAVECCYKRCERDGILVSAHLCRTSAVQCVTHTWAFCHPRRRAGPLTIPTCVFSFCFSPLAFYTIRQKIII